MRLTRREVLLAAALPAFAKTAARRPNIVLVVADDLGAWMLGCYGNQEIRTPNIDLLARGGTRFLYHIGCAPVGEANRAALLTGRPPHQQGSQDPRISDLLASAGYVCGSANPLEFLDSQKADRPFFLAVDYLHLLAPGGKIPAKYREMYAKTPFDAIGWEPAAPTPPATRTRSRAPCPTSAGAPPPSPRSTPRSRRWWPGWISAGCATTH